MTDEKITLEIIFIGSKVLLDKTFDCIVDDYFEDKKLYKLSFMGGGYAMIKKDRVTLK